MSKPRTRFNVGDRIGGWTLIEYPSGNPKVLVRCDCGFEAWRWRSNFYCGTSMGCDECRKKKFSTPAEKTFKMVLRTARRRGIAFGLTFDEWQDISQRNCFYCGEPPTNFILEYGYRYNGVDRVSSRGVYTMDNTVASCRVCNRAKSDMTKEEFYEWIDRVHAKS